MKSKILGGLTCATLGITLWILMISSLLKACFESYSLHVIYNCPLNRARHVLPFIVYR